MRMINLEMLNEYIYGKFGIKDPGYILFEI